MGSGRAPGMIYNHEYFVLCDRRGVVLGLYTDWERAMDARKPGDYVLTRKEADDARATRARPWRIPVSEKYPKAGGGDPAGE